MDSNAYVDTNPRIFQCKEEIQEGDASIFEDQCIDLCSSEDGSPWRTQPSIGFSDCLVGPVLSASQGQFCQIQLDGDILGVGENTPILNLSHAAVSARSERGHLSRGEISPTAVHPMADIYGSATDLCSTSTQPTIDDYGFVCDESSNYPAAGSAIYSHPPGSPISHRPYLDYNSPCIEPRDMPVAAEPLPQPDSGNCEQHGWEQWEHDWVRDLRNIEASEIIPDEEVGERTVRSAALKYDEMFNEFCDGAEILPTPHMRCAVLAIMVLQEHVLSDSSSELLLILLLFLFKGNDLRSHESGLFRYANGAWADTPSDYLEFNVLEDIAKALRRAEHWLIQGPENENIFWGWVKCAALHPDSPHPMPNESVFRSAFGRKPHGQTAQLAMQLVKKITGPGRSEVLAKNFWRWTLSPCIKSAGMLNFKDACVISNGGAGWSQIRKDRRNNCYVDIPLRLAWKPSDDTRLRLRKFLTIFGCVVLAR